MFQKQILFSEAALALGTALLCESEGPRCVPARSLSRESEGPRCVRPDLSPLALLLCDWRGRPWSLHLGAHLSFCFRVF